MKKIAVYTGNDKVYQDMFVSAKSLLINSDVDKIYFLIEHDKFPEDLPKEIETINVKDQTYFSWDGPNMSTPYSYMALMRAALPFVFPDLDIILSLDVDVIVDKDISDIWDIDISNYYFAAAHEWHRSHDGYLYTNAGVTLFNLKKLREEGKSKEVIDVLNTCYFRWVDQDVLNYLCQGRIYDLPSSYNTNHWTEKTRDRRVIHYAGIKNYQKDPFYIKYKNIPLEKVR